MWLLPDKAHFGSYMKSPKDLESRFAEAFATAAGTVVTDFECRTMRHDRVEIRVAGGVKTQSRNWFQLCEDLAAIAVTVGKRRMRYELKSSCDLDLNRFAFCYETKE